MYDLLKQNISRFEKILKKEVNTLYALSARDEFFNIDTIDEEEAKEIIKLAEWLNVCVDLPQQIVAAAFIGLAWRLFFHNNDTAEISLIADRRTGKCNLIRKEYVPEYFVEKSKNGKYEVIYNRLVNFIIKKYLPITSDYPCGIIYIWDGRKYKKNNGEIENTICRILSEFFDKKRIKGHTDEIMFRIQVNTLGDLSNFNFFEDIIPVKNGYLYNGILIPPSPVFMFTYCLNAKYNPNAKCEKIDKFIRDVVSEEDVKVLYEIPAVCLLNEQYHYAYMLYGSGGNGKSTYLNVLRKFLGDENISSVTFQELCENRFAAAQLFGKLANICADIPSDPVRYTGMFKMLTGGDKVKAEFKFKNPFEFVNRAKLVFSCNELPEANDYTEAFWRRWIIVKFPNKFGRNPDLLSELTTEEELSGFLNKVLEAKTRIELIGHPTITKTMEDIMNEWQKMANPVNGFAKECCVEDENSYETKEDVYEAYRNYCKYFELKIVSKNKFAIEFQKHIRAKSIVKKIAGKAVRCWDGIKLRCAECGKCGKGKDTTVPDAVEEIDLSDWTV